MTSQGVPSEVPKEQTSEFQARSAYKNAVTALAKLSANLTVPKFMNRQLDVPQTPQTEQLPNDQAAQTTNFKITPYRGPQ